MGWGVVNESRMSRRPEQKFHRAKAATGPSGDAGRSAPGLSRPGQSWWQGDGLACLALAIATLIAYQPVLRAGFIWDDDAHVTRSGLRSLHGLWRIWFEPGATQQYYPVAGSAFWLEHRIWGDAPFWYHLLNVALHAGTTLLLFRILRRLAVPGAFLAAAVFALHPVCVESVAWISEQKNTLSAVFYLSAGLAYLRYDRVRGLGWYALGTGLFVLAVLTKSVTATLPAALLVVFWWKRGRLSWRGDVLPLVPLFALGAGAGAMTAWMERTFVGASGAAYDLGLAGRFLVAGRALWFYLGKIVWPVGLTFIYPRWTIDSGDLRQYLFPAAAAGVLAALWAFRGRHRGPLAAALLFAGTLFPALGFVNVFPFVYSFVADHFQYLAAAIMLAAAAAALALGAGLLAPPARVAAWIAAFGIAALLGVLSWRQCAIYADSEILWRATIARNPACWMAYNNLAAGLLEKGRVDEAMADIQMALKLEPGNAAAYGSLGDALRRRGRVDEAIVQYGRALEIEPNNILVHTNLGDALLQAGHLDEAVSHYQRALVLKPDFASASANLGDALLQSGRVDDAIDRFNSALENDPDEAETHANLGIALIQKGRVEEAISHFERALEINPRFAIAETNLGNAFLQTGRREAAFAHYRRAVELDPDCSAAHNNLGYCLLQMGRANEAIEHIRKALEIDPGNAGAQRNLRDALSRRQ